MQVEIIEATANPVDVISLAAGICYGKDDVSPKRMANCVKMDHTSILEHAKVTFRIEGISRACMAQLTRHRMASFCVESQRYNKYDLQGDDWYVIPPAFADEKFVDDWVMESWFRTSMTAAAANYGKALAEGVKPEDARYLLPEATKTNLFVTMNGRELFHFWDMRIDKAAQWEIRELAEAMREAVAGIDGQWEFFAGLHRERQQACSR